MHLPFSSSQFSLGILGGGQLGRMLIQEAINLNVFTSVIDPDPAAPCRTISDEFVVGDFRDEETVLKFGRKQSLITVEIEHVNTDALFQLEASGIPVYPQPHVLRMVQDKGLQKEFYTLHHIPTASYVLAQGKEDVLKYTGAFPFVQKLRKGGYDGKGVMKIEHTAGLVNAFDAPSVLEECIDFEKEISVLVSRNVHGAIAHYPPVEMEFNAEANLVEFLCSPAVIEKETAQSAIEIARKLIDKTGMVGLLAVEMFVLKDGKILVNEIAPRPHNSGHQTIEGNVTSQYMQHLRAILGLSPGDTSIVRPSVMVNLLGEEGHNGEAHYEGIDEVLKIDGAYIHLYGKKITKPFRKMGHVTVTAMSLPEAIEKARLVQRILKVKCKEESIS